MGQRLRCTEIGSSVTAEPYASCPMIYVNIKLSKVFYLVFLVIIKLITQAIVVIASAPIAISNEITFTA